MNLSCVMLLPYVFRIPPVANMTPSYFKSIPWDPEEQEDNIWHCIYNATVSNNDWLQN
jgi:hypothetical protein